MLSVNRQHISDLRTTNTNTNTNININKKKENEFIGFARILSGTLTRNSNLILANDKG